MPIKKSYLEQKWYYRVAKVFFAILPWAALAFVFLKSGIVMPEKISQENIAALLQENINTIVYAAIGLAAYFIILNFSWKSFLYIAFGGLEDDTLKKSAETAQPDSQTVRQATQSTVTGALSEKDKKEIGFYVFILIMIGLIYWIYSYEPSVKNFFDGGNKNVTCIPTGCGAQWYCSGSYYDANGVRRSLNGCLPRKAGETYSSWSGTCRRCP